MNLSWDESVCLARMIIPKLVNLVPGQTIVRVLFSPVLQSVNYETTTCFFLPFLALFSRQASSPLAALL